MQARLVGEWIEQGAKTQQLADSGRLEGQHCKTLCAKASS